MHFCKMHGLGNDFIIVDARAEDLPADLSRLAVQACDRHFGIGADGLVVLSPPTTGDVQMRIINADGSEAEMCGNAVRCVAKYLYKRDSAARKEIIVETLGGPKRVELDVRDGRVEAAKVNMGAPELAPEKIPVSAAGGTAVNWPLDVAGRTVRVTCVSMGNPHCVILAQDNAGFDFMSLAPLIEGHPAFPHRTNVEWVEVLAADKLRVKVWERGVGPTLACGTGACAALVAAVLLGRADREAEVELPGGSLRISWPGDVFLQGPAVEVYRGEYFLEQGGLSRCL